MTASILFFFLNDPAPTDISPLPLHDPLPISAPPAVEDLGYPPARGVPHYRERQSLQEALNEMHWTCGESHLIDRKSTRLNSSHGYISYAVFCLKKKHSLITTPRMHHADARDR